MKKNKVRFYELDLLRFIAAMAVVMFHFLFRGQQGDWMPVSFEPLDIYARYGYLGVNLFFMISGFVILLSAVNRSATQFVISRVTRLYPAFWVGVTLTALVIIFFGSSLFHQITLPDYLVNLTMLAGFVGVEDVDGAYWTLYIELKFYAVIFVILLFNQIKKLEIIMIAWLVFILLSLFFPMPRIINFLLFPEWAPYFISGASFYLLKVQGISLLRLGILFIAFCLTLNIAVDGIAEVNADYHIQADPMVAVLVVILFHIIFTLMVFNKLSWFRSAWAVKIGALTYPLYIIHQNIGYIIFTQLADVMNKYALLLIVMIVLLALSWLIHTRIEKKFGPKLKAFLEKILIRNNTQTKLN